MVVLDWIHHPSWSRTHWVHFSAWIWVIFIRLRIIETSLHIPWLLLIQTWIMHGWELCAMTLIISCLDIQIFRRLSTTLPKPWLIILLLTVGLVVGINSLISLFCLVLWSSSIDAHCSLCWTLHFLIVVLNVLCLVVSARSMLAVRFIRHRHCLFLLYHIIDTLVLIEVIVLPAWRIISGKG